jgi:hypothetical protein
MATPMPSNITANVKASTRCIKAYSLIHIWQLLFFNHLEHPVRAGRIDQELAPERQTTQRQCRIITM